MNRRRVLAIGVTGLSVTTVGCTAIDGTTTTTDPGTPEIVGEEPTLAPGDSTRVEIEAANVVGLYLGIPLDDDNVDFTIDPDYVTPSPARQADSYPPKWYWDQCTDVDVEVPVEVASDADPGEYTYSVHATPCDDDNGDIVDREFTVTVEAN